MSEDKTATVFQFTAIPTPEDIIIRGINAYIAKDPDLTENFVMFRTFSQGQLRFTVEDVLQNDGLLKIITLQGDRKSSSPSELHIDDMGYFSFKTKFSKKALEGYLGHQHYRAKLSKALQEWVFKIDQHEFPGFGVYRIFAEMMRANNTVTSLSEVRNNSGVA